MTTYQMMKSMMVVAIARRVGPRTHGHLRRRWLPAAAAGLLLVGCASPLSSARKSLQEGDPVRAVELYETALVRSDRPAPEVEQELSAARVAAGASFAERAEQQLAHSEYASALRLAQQAVEYDAAQRSIEERVRHAYADHLLAEAQAALSGGELDQSRRKAQAARQVAPGLSAPDEMLARIDQAQAQREADRAAALLARGEFAAARQAADDARRLQPVDDTYRTLLEQIDRTDREAQFDALAAQLEMELSRGALASAQQRRNELAALGVRAERLSAFSDELNARQARVSELLSEAQSAHDTGAFAEAIDRYDAALALVSDRPQIEDLRAASVARLRVQELLVQGETAFDRGAYDEATDALARALDLDASPQVAARLREAEAAQARQRAQEALAAEEPMAAVQAIERLISFAPDDPLRGRLPVLRERVAEEALRAAAHHASSGQTGAASGALRAAMSFTSDPRLGEQLAGYEAERLLEQAIEAERRGRYDEAHLLYLNAFDAGGDREAIVARIDDVRELEAMQINMEDAIRHAEALDRTLASAEDALRAAENRERNLRQQIQDCEREIHRLDQIARHLSHDVAHLESVNHQLDDLVHHLEDDIRHLERELRHEQSQHERFRGKYDRLRHELGR